MAASQPDESHKTLQHKTLPRRSDEAAAFNGASRLGIAALDSKRWGAEHPTADQQG